MAGLKASGHIEYPLVLLLQEIQKPSKFNLSRWSNCIACSIQLTAQEFSLKPPPLTNLNNENLGSHLRILEYLTSCKSSAAETIPTDEKLRYDMSLKPLYLLHDLIIDIFITYSIIRGSAVADVEPEENAAESQALVLQKKQLDQYRSRHNYTPFCLYLVAGVRGLILAPTNRQFASGASALGFLGAIEHIFKKNIPQREGLEPVWRRLGAYIDSLFIESFLTPNCLFNFRQPQIIQLAQAITSDFLVCVQNSFPAKQFQLPRALTSKWYILYSVPEYYSCLKCSRYPFPPRTTNCYCTTNITIVSTGVLNVDFGWVVFTLSFSYLFPSELKLNLTAQVLCLSDMPGPQLLRNFCHPWWLIDYLLVHFLTIHFQDGEHILKRLPARNCKLN